MNDVAKVKSGITPKYLDGYIELLIERHVIASQIIAHGNLGVRYNLPIPKFTHKDIMRPVVTTTTADEFIVDMSDRIKDEFRGVLSRNKLVANLAGLDDEKLEGIMRKAIKLRDGEVDYEAIKIRDMLDLHKTVAFACEFPISQKILEAYNLNREAREGGRLFNMQIELRKDIYGAIAEYSIQQNETILHLAIGLKQITFALGEDKKVTNPLDSSVADLIRMNRRMGQNTPIPIYDYESENEAIDHLVYARDAMEGIDFSELPDKLDKIANDVHNSFINGNNPISPFRGKGIES